MKNRLKIKHENYFEFDFSLRNRRSRINNFQKFFFSRAEQYQLNQIIENDDVLFSE